MSLPWWPCLLVVLGMVAGVGGLVWRRAWATGQALVAGVAAAGALGIAVVAVLGEGFFEIAKHVWLAAYLLDVAALSVFVSLVPRAAHWVRNLVATPRVLRASEPETDPDSDSTRSPTSV